jgi:hypothetical protein
MSDTFSRVEIITGVACHHGQTSGRVSHLHRTRLITRLPRQARPTVNFAVAYV